MPFARIANLSKVHTALWIAQGLLAALFLFTGGMKLVLPISALTQQVALPGAFIRFIGLLEVLGALGLVLPGILRLSRALTPLAASGLVIVMSGAVGATLAAGQGSASLVPVIVGLLLALVAYGRVARYRPL